MKGSTGTSMNGKMVKIHGFDQFKWNKKKRIKEKPPKMNHPELDKLLENKKRRESLQQKNKPSLL